MKATAFLYRALSQTFLGYIAINSLDEYIYTEHLLYDRHLRNMVHKTGSLPSWSFDFSGRSSQVNTQAQCDMMSGRGTFCAPWKHRRSTQPACRAGHASHSSPKWYIKELRFRNAGKSIEGRSIKSSYEGNKTREEDGEVSRAQLVMALALQVMEPGLCLENSVEQKRHDQICVLERSQCGE